MSNGARTPARRPSHVPGFRVRSTARKNTPKTYEGDFRAEQAKVKQLTNLLNRFPKLFSRSGNSFTPTDLAQRSQKAIPAYSKKTEVGHFIPARVKLPSDGCFCTKPNAKTASTTNIIEKAKREAKELDSPTIIIVEPVRPKTAATISYLPTTTPAKTSRYSTVYLLSDGYREHGKVHTVAKARDALSTAETAYQAQLVEQESRNKAVGTPTSENLTNTLEEDTV